MLSHKQIRKNPSEVCNKMIPCDHLNEHNMSKKHKANIVQMRIKKQHNYSVCSKGVFIYGMNLFPDDFQSPKSSMLQKMLNLICRTSSW